MMRVELYAGPAREWDEFVANHASGTAAHLHAWRTIIRRVYGHDCPYLVARAPSGITGVLPIVDVRSLAFGHFLVSMPYLSAGGPLGDEQTAAMLIDAASSLARQRGASLVEFRCLQPLDGVSSATPEKITCVLDLRETVEKQWQALGSKLRSQIKRPQKEGIEVRFGAEQIEPFFRVFSRNMRDLGTPTHKQEFFRSIAHELSDQAWFGCAYLGNVPVAGGCALAWRGEVEMLWASSLREHNQLAPNMMLYWSFIERAISLGLNTFNFGRCSPGSGTHKFKMQWGTRDLPLYWYHWPAPSGRRAPPRQDHGSMAVATRLWRRLPLPLANMIGARLRGGIPS